MAACRTSEAGAPKGIHRESGPEYDRLIQVSEMVMMGQLGRFVDGIKSKLRSGGGRKRGSKKEAAMTYDKMDKTDSMRVEIRSRQAQKLIAKNLVAADSIGRRSNKRFFLAF
uniref:Uncharacterized protein n=1 Tax=Leersia perrieri TaxID=77586 RepID=A0A0D9X7U1_9ORYZ